RSSSFCSLRFVSRCGPPPDLHSFPTRRSSDLVGHPLDRKAIVFVARRLAVAALPVLNQLDNERRLRADRLAADRKRVAQWQIERDRKSTRLNSSHVKISYAVFCLKKKKKKNNN